MIENAVIKSVFIGFEDHGILTMYLGLDGGDWIQGFGGYNMQAPGELLRWVTGILKTLEKDKIADLTGTPVRVEHTGNAAARKIVRLGHFVKDKWFDPDGSKED